MTTLHPPPGFFVIEDELCRACFPLRKENAYFLQQNKLSTIIVVAVEDTDDFLSPFCSENGIKLHVLPFVSVEDFDIIGQFRNWVLAILQLILLPTGGPTLLLGSTNECYDAVAVACIRRLQHWGLPSTLEEFRIMAGRTAFDLEQFIEWFDPNTVKLPNRPPLYLVTEFDEDEYITAADDSSATAVSPPPALSVGAPDDAIVLGVSATELRRKILFPQKNEIISSNVKYDKSLSLVTDETED